jgi:hypothetical protein
VRVRFGRRKLEKEDVWTKRNLKHGFVELYGCVASISAEVAKMEIFSVAENQV